MRGYTPIIRIEVGGRNAEPGLYRRLIKATIRDEAGQESDRLTLELDDRGNAIEIPPKGAKLSVFLGYRETGLVPMGIFEFESNALDGEVGRGETVTLQANGASLLGKLKESGNEHFNEGTTFGEMVRRSLEPAGYQVIVDPQLDQVKMPFKARLNQSGIDFVTRLSDRFNAVTKVAGNKVVVARRGQAKAALGKALPPIVITKNRSLLRKWSIQSDPRPRYGRVLGSWIDQKTGKKQLERADTGFDGPAFILKHPFASQDEARRAADSEATRMTRNTGDGSFELYGMPEAQAEADVIALGFRREISGKWRAHAIEHEFTAGPGGGYITTVEVKAGEEGKNEKEDKEE